MVLSDMYILICASMGQPRHVHTIGHTFCGAETLALLVLFDLPAAWEAAAFSHSL